jgi:hypothetical protein
MDESAIRLEIRRRPWWMWVLAALWLAVEIFVLQSAIGSGAEHEPRAALILWFLFAVIAAGGVLIWVLRGRDS